jgi:hypothetical protein
MIRSCSFLICNVSGPSLVPVREWTCSCDLSFLRVPPGGGRCGSGVAVGGGRRMGSESVRRPAGRGVPACRQRGAGGHRWGRAAATRGGACRALSVGALRPPPPFFLPRREAGLTLAPRLFPDTRGRKDESGEQSSDAIGKGMPRLPDRRGPRGRDGRGKSAELVRGGYFRRVMAGSDPHEMISEHRKRTAPWSLRHS